MAFVRPDLAAKLHRWREAIAWAAVTAVGLFLIWRGYAGAATGPFALGVVLAGAGATLLRGAIGRAQLAGAAPGAGVLLIDEARVAYLGPFGGGFVDLARLTRVELTRDNWILSADDGTQLVVARGAEGADRLPDALTALPGLDLQAASGIDRAGSAVIWSRPSEAGRTLLPPN